MDTTKTDNFAVYIPSGLTVSQLVWIDARNLEIRHTGTIAGFGAKRVDLADRYFVSTGNMSLPINSGFAFNYQAPTPGNAPPQIVIGAAASPNPAAAGELIAFSVAASDPDGDALTYSWNFGDGGTASGQNVSHTYAAPGVVTATVTASDGRGGTAQSQVTLSLADPAGRPLIVDTAPTDGSTVTTAAPALQVLFNVDMDTSRTDPSMVVLPDGMTATGLVWSSPRSLEIQYDGQLDSHGAKYVDLRDRYFINTVGQWIPLGSGYAFVFPDPNNRPFIVVPPSATPPGIAPGQEIQFDVFGFDPDGDPLTYVWDFGDGATGTGMRPTHTYAGAGPFLVTVVVADGKGQQTVGTLLLNAPAASPWAVTRANFKLNFKLSGKDKINVQGVVSLPANWDPLGKTAVVDVGGNAQTFQLDKKGNAKNGKDRFKLTRKLKKKVFLGGAVKINFTIGGALAAKLIDDGLINETTAKLGVRRNVPVILTLAGVPYTAEVPVVYKARQGKTGSAVYRSAVRK